MKNSSSTASLLIEKNEKLMLLSLFLFALFIRSLYIFELDGNYPLFDNLILDARGFHNIAIRIFEDYSKGETLTNAPFYPFILGVSYLLFGQNLLFPRLLNAFSGSLLCIILYVLGKRMFNIKAGIAAALLAVFYKPYLFYDAQVLPVSLNVFVLSLTFLFLVIALEKSKAIYWFGAGICMGLSIMSRANCIVLPPFFCLWIFIAVKKGDKGNALYSVVLFVAGILITMLPSMLLTGDEGHKVQSYSVGENFFTGNNIDADGTMGVVFPEMRMASQTYRYYTRKAMEASGKKDISHAEVSRIWMMVGLKFIKDNPYRAIKLFIKKIFLFFNHYEIPGNASMYFMKNFSFIMALPLFSFGITGSLGITGLILSAGQWKKYAVFYIFLAVYTMSVVIFYVTSRFRMPITPVMILFASYSLTYACENIYKKGYNRLIFMTLILLPVYLLVNMDIIHFTAASSYSNLGKFYLSTGDTEKALAYFRMALKADPENGLAHLNIALAYRRQKRYEDALNELALALASHPQYARLYIEKGDVYMQMGRLEEAIDNFSHAYRLEPYFADAINNMGRVYFLKGDYKKAEEKFRKAIEIEKDFPMAYNNLGALYLSIRRYEEAIVQFKKALAYQPVFEKDNLSIRYNLGLAYMNVGDIEGAVKQFSYLISVDPSFINAYYMLGILYPKKDNLELGITFLKKALELAPEDREIRRELEKLLGSVHP